MLALFHGGAHGATATVQETRDLGVKVDVSNVADAIEILEGPTAR